MYDQPDEDRPMTEEEWEKMMKQSDLRAARFGELLETLHEHPNCHEIVAREMGWDHLIDRANDGEDELEEVRFGDQEPEESFNIADDQDNGEPFEIDEHDREVMQIPAYEICDRASEQVRNAIKPFQKDDQSLDEETVELIGQAWIGIHIACAKISGGHAMGYGDDVLCGNIVNNKRALEGARQSIDALTRLRERKAVPNEIIDRLLPPLREAEKAIVDRIEEMRSKVWWGGGKK